MDLAVGELVSDGQGRLGIVHHMAGGMVFLEPTWSGTIRQLPGGIDPTALYRLSGAAPFKKTVYKHSADYIVAPSTFQAIDATNIPALSLTLAVGDVVELSLRCTGYCNSGGSVMGFDWVIDRPTSANTNLRGANFAAAQFTQSGAGYATNINITRTFMATEAGDHTFLPEWKTQGGGNATIEMTGTYAVALEHVVRNLGQPAV